MKYKQLLAAAVLAATSICTFATPVFTGETAADFGTGDSGLPGASSSNAEGYYVWSSNSGSTWSVRWTGNDFGSTTWYDWFGSINLQNATDNSLVEVRFESSQTDNATLHTNIFGTTFDFINFGGQSGPHYDGFDFSVTDPETYQVIDFALGSSLFDNMTSYKFDQPGSNIFIGQNFATPYVQVQNYDGDGVRKVQRFEVAQVPEPGIIALLGLGLAGLGFARRRQQS